MHNFWPDCSKNFVLSRIWNIEPTWCVCGVHWLQVQTGERRFKDQPDCSNNSCNKQYLPFNKSQLPLYSFPWEYKPSAGNTETLCKRKVLCKIFLRRKTWSPERSHDRRPPRRVARIRHSSGKIGGTYPANWEYAKNTWKRPSSTKVPLVRFPDPR